MLLRQRSLKWGTSRPCSSGKDWTQAFYLRHSGLKAARMEAIDWQRPETTIRPKTVRWFQIMATKLSERDVYNLDETDILLSDLNTVKLLVARGDGQNCRNIGVCHTMITAVGCISADGRYLPPLITWPSKTLRSTLISYATPGWHDACNGNGYMDSAINLC